MSRRIAFFDVDKTVLDINSGYAWLKSEWQAGRMAFSELFKAGSALIRYSLGSTDIEGAMTAAIKNQCGESADVLRARTRSFLDRDVMQHIRQEAVGRLEWHRGQGDLCVLLTTSTQFLAEPLAEHLGCDGVLSTKLEVTGSGLLSGNTVGPICYGVGKIEHASGYARRVGSQLADATFYSDSYTDRPMLEAVGRPVVVTPDRRLRRFAKKMGWPIEEWS